MTTRTLRDIRFSNSRLDPVGVEVLRLSELRRSVHDRKMLGPERVQFFMLMVISDGRGEHRVDFDRIDLAGGRAMYVRPGQVHEWRLPSSCEGDVLLIEPSALKARRGTHADALMGLLRLEEWPSSFDLDTAGLSTCQQLAALLRHELSPATVQPVSAALARELAICILLAARPAALPDDGGLAAQSPLAQRFVAELEKRVMSRPTVDAIAMGLSVSTSTLNRTCHASFGRSAKSMIDRRVALEAKRLLVHTNSTSVTIGEQLGFTEPTNFLKFFRRRVGTTPKGFRRGIRPDRGG